MSASAGSGTGSGRWLPASTRLNDVYELDQGIAAGGMGEVYRGHNIHTGDLVAIKMIRTDVADTDSAMMMFRKEASALHNLFHEAIVRYYAFSVDPTLQRPYMVMEFVSGRSLSDIVKSGPMDYDAVRVLGARVASGLQVAHERGIIHRDISPDNIILPDDDVSQAKIIDFGIARQTKASEGTIIGDGFAGKYNYVSPEQLGLFNGDVTGASDIYSLGLVLAEMIAGRALNMRGNPVEVVEKRRVVPNLSHIDPRLQQILAWMLQPDPADRPGSMTEVSAWLKRRMNAAQAYEEPDDGHTVFGATVIAPERQPTGQWNGSSSRANPYPSQYPGQHTGSQRDSQWQDPRTGSRRPDMRPGSAMPSDRMSPDRMPPDRMAPGGSAFPRESYPPRETYPSRHPLSPQDRGDTVYSDPRQGTGRPGSAAPAGLPPYGATGNRDAASYRPGPGPAQPLPTTPPATAAEPARKKGPPVAILATLAIVLLAGAGGGAYVMLRPADAPSKVAQLPETPSRPEVTAPPVSGPSTASTPTVAPPVTVAPPAIAPSRPSERLRGPDIAKFVTAYDGGKCFYLAPVETSETDAVIEGYASSAAALDGFKAQFRAAAGFEPDIRLRLVSDAQCPIVTLLAATRGDGVDRPRLEVITASLRPGDLIAGEALPAKGRSGAVLLVAEDGKVTVLARSGPDVGGTLSFLTPVDGAAGASGRGDLVAVVTSPKPLEALSFEGTLSSADLAGRLETEMRSGRIALASAAQYLVFDR